MKSLNGLLLTNSGSSDPLFKGISIEDIPFLIEQLRKRCEVDGTVLDLSNNSLANLEECLISLSSDEKVTGILFDLSELLQIVREFAAYFGQVLVNHAGGKWELGKNLWLTEVIFENKKNPSQNIYFNPVNIVASSWDALKIDRKPIFKKEFRAAKIRSLKEVL